MWNPKLILIEGMPGTGKSTTSQLINRQLRASGRNSHWYHEEHTAHPVRLPYDSERHLSWSDYIEEAVSCWQNFTNHLQARNQIAVLDAAILQNHARSMLLFGCGWVAIRDLVRRIESVLVPLNPIWISLKPKDVEQNLRDVVQVRGAHLLDLWVESHERFPYAQRVSLSGYDAFIKFWREFDSLSDQVFGELSISKQQQIVPGDWGTIHGEILKFLQLPSPFDSSFASDLERFSGEYVLTNDRVASEFRLRVRDGCLTIFCSEATMDVCRGPIGCYRETRLIPNGINHFHVAAWPHEVEMIEDETGLIVGMCLSVSEDGWPPSRVVYQKQSNTD